MDIILWIIEHDDAVHGRGCNGFDICYIPWNFEKFRNLVNMFDKKFIDKEAYINCIKDQEDPRFQIPAGHPKCEKQ